MTGGFLGLVKKKGTHQIVHLTFSGQIDPTHARKWNESIAELNALFGHNVMGVTIKGDPTPPGYGKMVAKRSKK